MSRPTERTERCLDLDLLLPIKEAGYKDLRVTARMLGVEENALRRVVGGHRCTPGELQQVQAAWASYQPEALRELVAAVLGKVEAAAEAARNGGPVTSEPLPHPTHVRELRRVVERLLGCVVRQDV
jgi:hypothetical protein